MAEKFVGFYWTLRVNWNGFKRLPAKVEDAAANSKTIRYQMELVRKWERENSPGNLVEEIAFMDKQPDRATDAVKKVLANVKRLYGNDKATLLYVNFAEDKFWRRHRHLRKFIEEEGISALPLSPEPLTIDGKLFNPRKHFETWRRRNVKAKARLKENALAGIRQALSEFPEGAGRYKSIAETMNGRNIKTPQGGDWTEDNIRKYVSRNNLIPPTQLALI